MLIYGGSGINIIYVDRLRKWASPFLSSLPPNSTTSSQGRKQNYLCGSIHDFSQKSRVNWAIKGETTELRSNSCCWAGPREWGAWALCRYLAQRVQRRRSQSYLLLSAKNATKNRGRICGGLNHSCLLVQKMRHKAEGALQRWVGPISSSSDFALVFSCLFFLGFSCFGLVFLVLALAFWFLSIFYLFVSKFPFILFFLSKKDIIFYNHKNYFC